MDWYQNKYFYVHSSLTRFLSWCLDFLFSLSRPSRRVPPAFAGRPLIRWLFPPMMPRQLSEPHLHTCCREKESAKKSNVMKWKWKSSCQNRSSCEDSSEHEIYPKHYSMRRSKMLHLLFCVEGMEVVVIGELSAAGDVLQCKETDSVHPIHRPKTEKSQGSRVSGCSIHMVNFTFNFKACSLNKQHWNELL